MSSNASTYSGGTVLNAGQYGAFGTLIVGASSIVAGGTLTSGPLGIGTVTFEQGKLLASPSAVTLANSIQFTAPTTNPGGSFVDFEGGAANNAITFTDSASATATLLGTAELIVNTPTSFNEVLGSGAGTANLVLFSGSSTLTLSRSDTYFGNTVVNGGTLLINGAAGSLVNTNAIIINTGGTLTLDNTAANLPDRLDQTAPITLNGGTLGLVGSASSNSQENPSSIFLASGNSTIVTTPGSGHTVTLSGGTLTRSQGATVNFKAGTGTLGGTGASANQILFVTSPVPTGGTTNGNSPILPYATVTDATSFPGNTTGFNLATYGANGIAALTTYKTLSTSANGNNPNDNVLVTTSTTVAVSDTVNSVLLIGNGITVGGTAAGAVLTVGSGAVGSSGGLVTGNTLSVSQLAFATAEGILFTNSGTDTVFSQITGQGGLTISGAGNTSLQSPNLYTGPAGADQTETVITSGSPLAGSFTLAFNGQTTAAIAVNAAVSAVQTALQNLTTIGVGNVSVTGGGIGGNDSYFVTFTGNLGGEVLPQITVAANSLTGGLAPSVTVSPGQIGVSATAFNGGASGTGTLTLGNTTAIQQGLTVTNGTLQGSAAVGIASSLSLGAPNGQIDGLSGSSVVTIGGSNAITFAGGVTLNGFSTVLNITNTAPTLITSTVSNDPIDIDPSSPTAPLFGNVLPTFIKQGVGTLTLTAAATYTGTTWIQQGIVNIQNPGALGKSGDSVQTLTFSGDIGGTNPIPSDTLSGSSLVYGPTQTSTFTVTFNGYTSSPITWLGNNANGAGEVAASLQGALDTLPSVGPGNALVANSGGYADSLTTATTLVLTIIFQNQLGSQSLPLITANTANLVGGASPPTITTAILTQGAPAAVVVGTAGAPATLQLQSGNPGFPTLPANLTAVPAYTSDFLNHVIVSGAGVGGQGAINNLNGSSTLNGLTTLYSAASIGGTFPLTLLGTVAGGGDLTKVGSNQVVMAGVNSFTGALNINTGQVESQFSFTPLGNSVSGVTVASGASLVLGAGASITGKPLTLNGTGNGFVESPIPINQTTPHRTPASRSRPRAP